MDILVTNHSRHFVRTRRGLGDRAGQGKLNMLTSYTLVARSQHTSSFPSPLPGLTSDSKRRRYVLLEDGVHHPNDERCDDWEQDSDGHARELPALYELDAKVRACGQDLHELVAILHLLWVMEEVSETHVLRRAHARGPNSAGVDAGVVGLGQCTSANM